VGLFILHQEPHEFGMGEGSLPGIGQPSFEALRHAIELERVKGCIRQYKREPVL